MKRILAERSVLRAFGATVLALLLLVAWTRELRPGWLAAAAVAVVIAGVLSWRTAEHRRSSSEGRRQAAAPSAGSDSARDRDRGRRWRRGRRPQTALLTALGLLGAGIVLGAVFTWQFQRIERDWPGLVERRAAGLGGSLSRQMSDVVDRGGETSRTAAQLAASRRTDLFRRLQVLRDQMRVDALAVYTTGGDLVAWAGEHRGPMPDSIWIRGGGAYFEERPLFSYLYFSTPVPGRAEYAVAAVLVETGIIGEGKDGAFADIVAARTRTRATFRRGGGADAVWSLTADADTVVHARLHPLSQAEWRGVLNRTARRAVLLAALGAALVLAIGWLRWAAPFHSRLAASAPLLLLVPIAALAPLRDATGAERFFSPLLFTLPLPFDGDVSLGRLLVLMLPIAALTAGSRRREWRGRAVPLLVVAGAIALAVAYPALLALLLHGATPALLQSSAPLWLGLQLAAVLALGLVTLIALPRAAATHALADPAEGSHGAPASAAGGRFATARLRHLLLAGGVVVSAGFGLAVAAAAQPDQTVRLWTAALWGLPFLMVAPALVPASGRRGGIARWLVVGWLASTAVLPHIWSAHLGARLAAAEGELETLGTRADPYLDYLLVTFGREAEARFAAGEEGVQLLYRTWVASGLAQEPYAARIVLWSAAGLPDVQLGLAPLLLEAEANRLTSLVEDARGLRSPLIAQFADLPNVSRMLTVPLPDGALITVVVPPRRSLERTSAVAPFLGAVAPSAARLNLIEAAGTEPEHESMHWVETAEGWRSEAVIKYPDGWYHAHLIVPVAGVGVRMVRAALLISFNLLLLGLLWVIGVVARGGAAVPGGAWRNWLGSFRARITLALFGFFIVPTALFGWAAYSALAGEVARSAQHLAQHAVNQAVIEFDDAGGDLHRLAAHAGSDVLRYHGGELIDVSSREALDLGVYSAWMPPQIYQRLQSGEEREALESQSLGQHSFVTAYRTLPPTGTLGVPKSLSVGEAAQRLQELAHLVMFAAVLGAILSLMLSVAVGRTLAGPIGQLRRASAAVGAGTLRVRLPERAGDEFGELFASFNRMTRRLRRARARELRSARVLAWGEMARQVAHEIKNPLTPIKLSVQHLRRAHRDRHPQFEQILDSNVTQILAEIDRLSEIARAFSRYGAPADAAGPLTAVNVPAVIRESLMLYRSGDRHVSYIDDVEPDLPLVQARTDELKEVLLNLVENSRAAIDGAGEITVRATHVGDRVELEVADTGPGIEAELIGRIFEPHFSTRSTGTGLGLAIVRRLVESWGGSVTADSELGRGTVVRIRLLVATAPGS